MVVKHREEICAGGAQIISDLSQFFADLEGASIWVQCPKADQLTVTVTGKSYIKFQLGTETRVLVLELSYKVNDG